MTTPLRDTFCSYCGTAYAPPLAYPRTCAECKVQVWANPIPVSIVLLPVSVSAGEGSAERVGLLAVRRGIEPGKGKLALVGGFLEEHETCAEGGARELFEETGVTINLRTITPFWFTSTAPRPNRVLLFSIAEQVSASSIAPFAPNHETEERGLVFGPGGLADVFAFSLHVEAARRFFEARGVTGEHAFTRI